MCDHSKCECYIFSMDSTTPLNLYLSAFFRRSFAFYTIKERLPVIITKILDHLVRDKDKIVTDFGEESKDELKTIIGELSKLKYEIQTNKPLAKFNSDIPDTQVFDWCIGEQSTVDGLPRYYTTIWLLAECYTYRRVVSFFENKKILNKYDPFRWQKKEAFTNSESVINSLLEYFLPVVSDPSKFDKKDEFFKLLKVNLWGNRCDLAISLGEVTDQVKDPMQMIEEYEPFVLCNESEKVWDGLMFPSNPSKTIEIICDNAGFEIITDFCLADFLITYELAETVVLNLKAIPWFVSDAVEEDLRWIIRKLIASENENLKNAGIRWNKYLREKNWIIEQDIFWTYPMDYTQMETKCPELYERLKSAKMLFFKGDLNYRKLFGEKKWESFTPVNEARANFCPTKWCTLRTLKADIVCGLEPGVSDRLDETDKDWMISGNYGVIQFSDIDMMEEGQN